MTVKVRCYTNLDDYKREDWPTELPAAPARGDYVKSFARKKLRVVARTWCRDILELELHR